MTDSGRALLPARLPAPADPPWCKLLIWNARQECLLARFRGQWEVPGSELPATARLSETECQAFLTQFARELGIELRSLRRAATVVQHFAQGRVPTPFLWYEAWTTEEPSAPAKPLELAWQPLPEALDAIPYPSGRLIVGEYEVDYTIAPPGGRLQVFQEIAPEPGRLSISPERPDTPDAQSLIAALDAELDPLYPSESRHGYSVERLLQQGVVFFVLRVDGQPAGCGGLQLFPDGWAELKRMYVRPEHRGQRLAQALLEHLAAYAQTQNVTLLRLETGIHQSAAIQLYTRFGFTETGPFGDYCPDPLSKFFERQL